MELKNLKNKYQMEQKMIKLLKKLKDWVSPSYWAELIGHKYGLWDWALNNDFRQY